MTKTPLLIEHLDLWCAALTTKSASGRGNNNKLELYGLKKLRELILELAVRGLLVPQDPHDEPASALLKKIAAEKARLIKAGQIKQQKKLPSITEDEKPFDLPQGWEWAFLGNLASDIHYGYTASAQPENKGIRLLRITDIQNDKVNWENVPGCEITEQKAEGYLLENNDVLIARTGGTIGKSYLVENIKVKAVFASYLIRVKRISSMYSPYIKTYLGSLVYWSQLYDNASGTGQPNVNATALKRLLVPIPPLAEQHRIVAKVDELMALCERLEARQEASISTHRTLVHALLSALTDAGEHGRFEDAWARIAASFDLLFSTEESIDLLKQSILQLAVMGRLAPQNPQDEPASALLKKIAAEKARLVKAGKIKKQKKLPPITEDEKPFELPQGWEFCRLQDIISISSGTGLTAAQMASDGKIPVYGGNGITGYHDKGNVFKETFVIGRVGYYCGSIHITPSLAWVTDNAFITTFSEKNIYMHYLAWLLKATNLKENENATAQPVISGRKIYPIVVAIPPTEEQHRIVARVDELMALCDRLHARIRAARVAQQQLADAMAGQVRGETV